MNRSESERYVAMIRRAGLPYREALTDFYRKYSFALTPLIVAFIASSLGSAFKKNILLMSLLSALVHLRGVLRGADGLGDPFEERRDSPARRRLDALQPVPRAGFHAIQNGAHIDWTGE